MKNLKIKINLFVIFPKNFFWCFFFKKFCAKMYHFSGKFSKNVSLQLNANLFILVSLIYIVNVYHTFILSHPYETLREIN